MKEIIVSSNAPAAIGPYSHAVAMEGIVFTSGQLGIDPATGKMAEGVEAQAAQALANLENVLKDAGASMRDVVKTTVFVQDLGDFCGSQQGIRREVRRGVPRTLLRTGCGAARKRPG